MQQLAEYEVVVRVWLPAMSISMMGRIHQRWTNGAGSRPCETHTPFSRSQPRLDPGEPSAKAGEGSVPAHGCNGDTILSRFHTLTSRFQPGLEPGELGANRTASSAGPVPGLGWKRQSCATFSGLPTFTGIPGALCQVYILLLYSEYIMGMKCLRVEYITLRRCAGGKKISCTTTVYDCFVRVRVLKSYYAEKS